MKRIHLFSHQGIYQAKIVSGREDTDEEDEEKREEKGVEVEEVEAEAEGDGTYLMLTTETFAIL